MKAVEKLLMQVQALNKAGKYQEMIDQLPDGLLEKYNSADLYAEKAAAYYWFGDKEICFSSADKALQINPFHANANYYKGCVLIDQKRYDKAIECYNKTIESDPGFFYAYNGLGRAYNGLKQYEKAIECYQTRIAVGTESTISYNGLGNAYYEQKQYDKAIESYNKSIEIDHQYPAVYYNRATIYFDLGRYKESLADYVRYVELTKDTPDYYTDIAQSKIVELNKLIADSAYSGISELVKKIKKLLLFKDNCVTHYTSLSVTGFLVLNGSLLRLSEGAFLNDTSEGRELFKFLPFHVTTRQGDATVAEPFAQKPFIGSFVAESKHDDLTLWRMYGKEAKEEARGCAITLDRNKLLQDLTDKLTADNKSAIAVKSDEEYSFYRVAYRRNDNYFIIPDAKKGDEARLNKYMKDLAGKVNVFKEEKEKTAEDTQNVLERLNEIAYLFKSAEYQYEHEVRLVIKGVGFEKTVDPKFTPARVYIELVSISSVVSTITLGPKVEKADEWAAAFYYSLDKLKYYPKILISHLPFK